MPRGWGSCTVLDYREQRPVQVLHGGVWFDGWLTAYRQDADGWWGMVRWVVDVGRMHWHWKHETELRRV